jgi:hypothetical protein
MVLSNSAKKARNQNALVRQNQGGGSKKAGFPYQVGRSSATSVAFGTEPSTGACCKLGALQISLFPIAKPSRPIGSITGGPMRYWKIPGTRG